MDRTEKIDIKNGKMFVQAESYQGVNVVRISAYDGGWTVFIPASEAVVYCNNFKAVLIKRILQKNHARNRGHIVWTGSLISCPGYYFFPTKCFLFPLKQKKL